MKRLYAITVEDGEITDLVYEILTCRDCRDFEELENNRIVPTICHNPRGMVRPSPDSWCSCGREKDNYD